MAYEDQLWANDESGSICCFDHAGMYLRTAHAARPSARSHWTPLGTWRVMTEADLMAWIEEFDDEPQCEMCGKWAALPGWEGR